MLFAGVDIGAIIYRENRKMLLGYHRAELDRWIAEPSSHRRDFIVAYLTNIITFLEAELG